jgi:hypothetical protein
MDGLGRTRRVSIPALAIPNLLYPAPDLFRHLVLPHAAEQPSEPWIRFCLSLNAIDEGFTVVRQQILERSGCQRAKVLFQKRVVDRSKYGLPPFFWFFLNYPVKLIEADEATGVFLLAIWIGDPLSPATPLFKQLWNGQ